MRRPISDMWRKVAAPPDRDARACNCALSNVGLALNMERHVCMRDDDNSVAGQGPLVTNHCDICAADIADTDGG